MIAKTPEDIDALREGGRRLARHVSTLVNMLKPGLEVTELEKRAREMVATDGDELAFFGYPSGRRGEKYPTAICLSINDAIVHGIASQTDYVLQGGDVVSIDFGVKHKGLYTDHAKTAIVGSPLNTEDEKLVRGTYEALAIGIAAAKQGGRTGDIGAAVEAIAKKYHFGFPRDLAGHGVGRALHEDPHVPNYGTAGTGALLEHNLVIAIEPMMTLGSGDLYVDKDNFTYRTKDGSRAAHAEHTVIITEVGVEILTKE
ncbi:type I methionyl aminopeptidase [Candidatus Kaiserbacteria bacterium]|nr:type I methionyl aminopeptidase [Candidatus Kaiserbacteria bacterium]